MEESLSRVAPRCMVFAICAITLTVETVTPSLAADGIVPKYQVQCGARARSAVHCLVSKSTYVGWRMYHASCNHCHGQDGLGGSFAPSLVDSSAGTRDYNRFKDITQNGYSGQVGVMPAYKDNPNINDKIDSIYAYLKARTDGVLPRGRPGRVGE